MHILISDSLSLSPLDQQAPGAVKAKTPKAKKVTKPKASPSKAPKPASAKKAAKPKVAKPKKAVKPKSTPKKSKFRCLCFGSPLRVHSPILLVSADHSSRPLLDHLPSRSCTNLDLPSLSPLRSTEAPAAKKVKTPKPKAAKA